MTGMFGRRKTEKHHDTPTKAKQGVRAFLGLSLQGIYFSLDGSSSPLIYVIIVITKPSNTSIPSLKAHAMAVAH